MKKSFFIILAVVVVALLGVASTADAAKRKTAGKHRTTQTSKAIAPTESGISIKTFCKYETFDRECGRIISILESDEIINKLERAGYNCVDFRTETRNADYTGMTEDPYSASIITLQRIDSAGKTVITVDSDGGIEIKFPSQAEYNKFLSGCKSMGYRDQGDGYYTDGAKCHWAGSSLNADSSTMTITISIVSEA